MQWQEICEHSDLQNLPFKIELDEKGRILMSPVRVYHSVFQGEIAAMLQMHRKDGKILKEIPPAPLYKRGEFHAGA